MPNYYSRSLSILQVFFHKKWENFQKKPGIPMFSKGKTRFRPGHPAVLRLGIHQHNIRADPADAVPGDHIIVPSAPKPEKPAGTGDDDGEDIPFRQFDPGIGDIPKPPPVCDTNHFFAVQVRKFRRHTQPPNNRLVQSMMQPERICLN